MKCYCEKLDFLNKGKPLLHKHHCIHENRSQRHNTSEIIIIPTLIFYHLCSFYAAMQMWHCKGYSFQSFSIDFWDLFIYSSRLLGLTSQTQIITRGGQKDYFSKCTDREVISETLYKKLSLWKHKPYVADWKLDNSVPFWTFRCKTVCFYVHIWPVTWINICYVHLLDISWHDFTSKQISARNREREREMCKC